MRFQSINVYLTGICVHKVITKP